MQEARLDQQQLLQQLLGGLGAGGAGAGGRQFPTPVSRPASKSTKPSKPASASSLSSSTAAKPTTAASSSSTSSSSSSTTSSSKPAVATDANLQETAQRILQQLFTQMAAQQAGQAGQAGAGGAEVPRTQLIDLFIDSKSSAVLDDPQAVSQLLQHLPPGQQLSLRCEINFALLNCTRPPSGSSRHSPPNN